MFSAPLPPSGSSFSARLFALISLGFTTAMEVNIFRMAASLSYHLLLSAAPLLIVFSGIAVYLFDGRALDEQLAAQIELLLGPQMAAMIGSGIETFVGSSTTLPLTVFGGLLALWGASRAVVELHSALNAIWRVGAWDGVRGNVIGLLRRRLVAFLLVLGTGFVLGLVLFAGPIVQALGRGLEPLVPDMVNLARVLSSVVWVGVGFVMLMIIFRTLPETRIAWSDVWLGTALAMGLLVLGAWGLRLFIRFTSTYAVLGLATSPLFGLYLVNYAVLGVYVGAVCCTAYSQVFGSLREPGEADGQAGEADRAASSAASRSGESPARSG